MKKLRKNSGFTLVECVVAMAVLAVMMLGLLMIMSVTVRQRNLNTQSEHNVDNQVEQIVQGNGTDGDPISGGDIDFGSGIVISGAQMVIYDDPNSDMQIGAVKYDVSYTPSTGEPGDSETPPEEEENLQPSSIYKIYGATETQGNKVTVYQQGSPTDNGDGTYTVTWRIDFNVVGTIATEKSLKVVFPSSSKIVSHSVMSGNCKNVHKLGNSTVRIEPGATGNIQVDVKFIIPSSDYSATLIQDHFGASTPAVND